MIRTIGDLIFELTTSFDLGTKIEVKCQLCGYGSNHAVKIEKAANGSAVITINREGKKE